ncbi:hypothetical protein [Marinomonas atlantica]|uniref:hypothetical protein n=1 Tax=Marinomonas atlantica TaxID=1806668 RepID=UPI00082E586F|nr:hypothetical protein [Marinomonas atlantica]
MGQEITLAEHDVQISNYIGALELNRRKNISKENEPEKKEHKKKFNEIILNILRDIQSNYDYFDKSYLGFERKGNVKIIEHLKSISYHDDSYNPEYFFKDLFPVYLEFLIVQKGPYELDSFISSVEVVSFSFSEPTKRIIDRYSLTVPSTVMSYLLKLTKSSNVKDVLEIESKVDGYNSSLSNNIEQIKGLESRIDNLKSEYNFMALSHGFERILSEKKKKSNDMSNYLFVMGILIMVPVMIVLMFLWNSLDDLGVKVLYVTAPMLTLSFTMIYFFRIILSNYNELKPEILQMELRVTLCSFIEDYIKYSKDIKKEDKEALAMFEKVVFSEINDARNPAPAFFEGLEGIANVINSSKK